MDMFKGVTNLDNEYSIKILSKEDENKVQELCEKCSDFFMLIEGRLPEKNAGYEILNDLPPKKELKDKYVFGVYKDSTYLVAVVDFVKDYKIIGEWLIGLLMIDPSERGKGLGERIHDFLKNTVMEFHAHKLRIGVVEENHRAYNFWIGLGYIEVNRVNVKYGNNHQTVIVMNYFLQCG